MSGTKNNMPKDLQSMSNILRDFGITEYESGVENHMLDFSVRYITTLVEDAQLYSTHAGKKGIDIDDVKLAIQLQQDKTYTSPPSREITATMARQRNTTQLPTIRSSAGLRLPPDRHSLIASNFHLKTIRKPRTNPHSVPRLNISSITPGGTPIVPRPSFNIQKPPSAPVVKFSEANKGITPTTVLSPMSTAATVSSANSSVNSQILMPTVGIMNEVKLSNDGNSLKRPLDEDDNYDI